MLPKARRLPRRDFLITKSQGKTSYFSHFTIIYYLNSPDLSRFSVITSGKLHKHAVVRNQLRRSIYSAVKNLPLSGDFIIIPKPSILSLSISQLSSLFESSLCPI